VKKYQNNNITNHALLACMWVGLRRVLRLIALHLLCQQAAGCLSGFRICIHNMSLCLVGRHQTNPTWTTRQTDRQHASRRMYWVLLVTNSEGTDISNYPIVLSPKKMLFFIHDAPVCCVSSCLSGNCHLRGKFAVLRTDGCPRWRVSKLI
jgi:hypothetical protein